MNLYTTIRYIALCFIAQFVSLFPATIVLLQGTCSVGKTTMCNHVENLDSRWKIITNVSVESLVSKIKKVMPIEMNAIEKAVKYDNIYHAIIYDKELFIENISDETKNDARQALQRIRIFVKNHFDYRQEWREYVLKKAQEIDALGFDIIIDTVQINPQDIEDLKKYYKVVVVLAYAPLNVMFDRLLKRNKQCLQHNNLMQERGIKHIFTHYQSLYELSLLSDSHCIDTLKKKDIENILQRADEYYAKSSFINQSARLDFLPNEWLLCQNNFRFFFENAEIRYVKPKCKYDFLLRIDEVSSINVAQRFINIINGCVV